MEVSGEFFVDYEQKTSTNKDHFSLPFINQVIDSLLRNKYFSFLDGFSGYNQIQIAPKYEDKMKFSLAYFVL
jgi:hypothetical protein